MAAHVSEAVMSGPMRTIEIPESWVFVKSCGCVYGWVLSDQVEIIIATEEQAWRGFYENRKKDLNKARKSGSICRPIRKPDDLTSLLAPKNLGHSEGCVEYIANGEQS